MKAERFRKRHGQAPRYTIVPMTSPRSAETTPRRSFWGWGNEDGGLDEAEREALKLMMGARLGVADLAELAAPRLEDLRLPEPRFTAPSSLAAILAQDRYERAAHTYGKAFRDVVRGLEGDFTAAPDAVALPKDEEDLRRVLAFCEERSLAAIPYGGGSSVVGGVEARVDGRFGGAVSIDLRFFNRVLEVDAASRAARIQGGMLGPALEEALRPHGLSLRHYPQSFEFSSLGGWIATRAGGHYATLHTHIDDFVESVRVVTPSGVLATRRFPASGAGPAPERLVLGSEGALGVITEAWMRLQERPRFPRLGHGALRRFFATARRPRARSCRPASTRRTAACSTGARSQHRRGRRIAEPAPARLRVRRSWPRRGDGARALHRARFRRRGQGGRREDARDRRGRARRRGGHVAGDVPQGPVPARRAHAPRDDRRDLPRPP